MNAIDQSCLMSVLSFLLADQLSRQIMEWICGNLDMGVCLFALMIGEDGHALNTQMVVKHFVRGFLKDPEHFNYAKR